MARIVGYSGNTEGLTNLVRRTKYRVATAFVLYGFQAGIRYVVIAANSIGGATGNSQGDDFPMTVIRSLIN